MDLDCGLERESAGGGKNAKSGQWMNACLVSVINGESQRWCVKCVRRALKFE